MNVKDLLEKLKAYPVATVAGALALAVFGLLYFRWMGFPEQQRQLDNVSRDWVRVESNVFKNSVNLETHLAKAEGISQDVTERLIRSSELARNYQYFYRMETMTGVQIESLQQVQAAPPAQPPAGAAARRAAEAAQPPATYSKVGFNMNVAGRFGELLPFLNMIENGQHIARVKTFNLQRTSEGDSRLISISMQFDLLGHP